MKPLMDVELGRKVTVANCMLSGEQRRHLFNLGLLPGEAVIPIAHSTGNLIFEVKGSRLAVDTGIAWKIFVV